MSRHEHGRDRAILFNQPQCTYCLPKCFDINVNFSSSDIDECQRILPCLRNSTCINTNGSYECICDVGWMGRNCATGLNLQFTYDNLIDISRFCTVAI